MSRSRTAGQADVFVAAWQDVESAKVRLLVTALMAADYEAEGYVCWCLFLETSPC